MKYFIFLASILLFSSCSKEALEFSCNPEVDSWVKQNKETYAGISRTRLATEIDFDRQRALFVSFSPEQKVNIYQQKYQYLMELKSLSQEEKVYLTKLFQHVKPEIYSSESSNREFTAFADEWTNEVQNVLGWTELDVFRYTHTWFTNEEFEEWINYKQKSSTLKSTGEEPPCECYYSISCVWGFFELCEDGGCTINYNCGISSTSKCTGLCKR
ncbi:MAG: bacteriocin fulvocin C-related protein [Bacteroidales bacterium]|jgi:hypothetical protein|nr:bacteriocin fulvocin C-related protein [Bacteroidales bacterium]